MIGSYFDSTNASKLPMASLHACNGLKAELQRRKTYDKGGERLDDMCIDRVRLDNSLTHDIQILEGKTQP